jgi:hypothetical protein
MAATDRHHGKTGQIKMDKTGGSTAVVIPSLDSWDLDLATDTVSVTSYEDTNKTYVMGLPDVKGTFAGNYDDSPEGLVIFDIFKGSIAPLIELIPDRTMTTPISFNGHGYVSGKITVPAEGKIAVSGSFVAADSWTIPGSGS